MKGKSKKVGKRLAKAGSKGSSNILDKLTSGESTQVLWSLLARHPELREETQEMARELVATEDVEYVADSVRDAVSSLSSDEMHGRAGRTFWGYVEPAEAAWELLEESVAEFISDMKRKTSMGLVDAGEAVCRGIVIGLYRSEEYDPDALLAWAEDFPAEEGCHAVMEFIRGCPPSSRRERSRRLMSLLVEDAPEWTKAFGRVLEVGTISFSEEEDLVSRVPYGRR